MNIESKTILITGASTGIGKATAQKLMEQPHHLLLLARRKEKILDWIDQIPPSQIKATFEIYALDVSCKEDVDAFFEQLEHDLITLHVLVNNAGFAKGIDTVRNASAQDWQDMMQTNFFGAFYMAQQALKLMPRHAGSRIINVGSIAGLQAYAKGGGYCASKFSLRALTQTLRNELLEDGIGVGSIDPGLVETEFSKVRLGDDVKAKQVYQGMTPLFAEDIAEMIAFMISRPPHVNIDQLVTMPTAQASAHYVFRKEKL
ncbi:MAG: SDR family NAD(P)-dependent oxidoreductase [Deltaproteobacteria bacterium]|nr:SDR family NAD(P)-dependent oxidoreductase [Deltaproteobacteria bacterium]